MRSDGVVPIRMVRGHPWTEHQHHGSSRVVDRRAHGFLFTALITYLRLLQLYMYPDTT